MLLPDYRRFNQNIYGGITLKLILRCQQPNDPTICSNLYIYVYIQDVTKRWGWLFLDCIHNILFKILLIFLALICLNLF